MIKLLLLPSLLIIFIFGMSGQSNLDSSFQEFKVDGYLKNSKDGVVVLGFYDFETSKPVFLDTSNMINGNFNFNGKIKGAVKAAIFCNNAESNMFFVDTGHNVIKGFLKIINSEVKILIDTLTSKSNLDAKRKEELTNKIYLERGKVLYERYNFLDSILNDSLKLDYDSALKNEYENCKISINSYNNYFDSMSLVYIQENPESFESAFDFCFQVNTYSVKKASEKFNLFSNFVKQSSYGQYIYAQINKNESILQLNNLDFTTVDINGDTIRLSDLRENYVLLDFWASWCKPCRESHPKLLSLYALYKTRGLEIISISSDGVKGISNWKKAISNDSIGNWVHVLDNLEEDKNLSSIFRIKFIPTKVLINKEGIIIGMYQSEDFNKLQTDLEKVFK